MSFSIIASIPIFQLDSGRDMVNECCHKQSLTMCQIYIAKGHRVQH